MPEEFKNTYFVTGGGTGGHIYPALAVADNLREHGKKIFYVGNKYNMEFELAQKNGFDFLHVGICGMPRKNIFKILVWGFKLALSVIFSVIYIKKYCPSVVFATGGYVSAPMVFASIITKTPYIMHDCDAMPGLVTRNLSKNAACVTLAFKQAQKFIPNKNVYVTGNPIRKDFKTITKESARKELGIDDKITLTVMGGSQGAKSINETVIQLLKEFIQDDGLQIIFQTGKKNFDEIYKMVKLIYPAFEQDGGLILKPYFDNMVSVLKASDIVISRAGSLSLSEISASGIAPILIPYPHAAANHQRINAKTLLEVNACVYIEDSELEPNKLRDVIHDFLENPVKLNYLKQNCSNLAKLDATEEITQKILDV